MFKRYQFLLVAVLCGSLGLGLTLGANALAQAPADAALANTSPPPSAADSGVTLIEAKVDAPQAGSGSQATPLDDLADVKAKYDALRAAQKNKSATMLLWAAMLAAALKLLLSLFTKYVLKESKSWMKWVALGAAVPIALLSHFALGNSLFDSLVFAGAGPGAIIVHELLKRGEKS